MCTAGFGASTTTAGNTLFEAAQPQQQASTLFGSTANKPVFGAATATSTATTGFTGFGQQQQNTAGAGLFGQNNQQKVCNY